MNIFLLTDEMPAHYFLVSLYLNVIRMR